MYTYCRQTRIMKGVLAVTSTNVSAVHVILLLYCMKVLRSTLLTPITIIWLSNLMCQKTNAQSSAAEQDEVTCQVS